MPAWAERKRSAWPDDLKRFISRSRRRVGWCEFSARLLGPLCCRCSIGQKALLGSPIAGQLVGDHDARRMHLLLEIGWLAQQAFSGGLVAPALDREHRARTRPDPPPAKARASPQRSSPRPHPSAIRRRLAAVYQSLDGSMVLMRLGRGFTGMSYAAFRCVSR
jgi:hypothetical protein